MATRPRALPEAAPRVVAGLAASIFLLAPLSARAGDESELTCDLAIDVPITVASLALAVGVGVAANKPAPGEVAATPTGIDTWAPRSHHPAYGVPNGLIVLGSMAAGLFVPPLASKGAHWVQYGVLYAEAIAITAAFTDVAKATVRRPRPYTRTEPTGEIDDYRSFFSADAATTGAALFFAARAVDLTHDLPAWERMSLYGGASLLTTIVAVLRVAEGKHYPSDVIVGSIVGASIGFLVPEMHRRRSVTLSAAPLTSGGGTLTVAGHF